VLKRVLQPITIQPIHYFDYTHTNSPQSYSH